MDLKSCIPQRPNGDSKKKTRAKKLKLKPQRPAESTSTENGSSNQVPSPSKLDSERFINLVSDIQRKNKKTRKKYKTIRTSVQKCQPEIADLQTKVSAMANEIRHLELLSENLGESADSSMIDSIFENLCDRLGNTNSRGEESCLKGKALSETYRANKQHINMDKKSNINHGPTL